MNSKEILYKSANKIYVNIQGPERAAWKNELRAGTKWIVIRAGRSPWALTGDGLADPGLPDHGWKTKKDLGIEPEENRDLSKLNPLESRIHFLQGTYLCS